MSNDPQPNRRPAQCWYSVPTLATLLELSPQTIRRHLQAGLFGPPPGAQPTDYTVSINGDPRVSTLGYYHYLNTHPYRYTDTVRARNTAELRRKLQQLPKAV